MATRSRESSRLMVATSGARAATEAALRSTSDRDRVINLVFVSMMVFALGLRPDRSGLADHLHGC
jgi:hypothetical protein